MTRQPQTAVYIRYSSDKQSTGHSEEMQLSVCEDFIKRSPDVPDKRFRVFKDLAKTGRTVAGRGALKELVEEIEDGKIKTVVVYRWDRVGRNLLETGKALRVMERAGASLISAQEGADPFVRNILLSVAEKESRNIAQRTFDGQCANFEYDRKIFCFLHTADTGNPAAVGSDLTLNLGSGHNHTVKHDSHVLLNICSGNPGKDTSTFSVQLKFYLGLPRILWIITDRNIGLSQIFTG